MDADDHDLRPAPMRGLLGLLAVFCMSLCFLLLVVYLAPPLPGHAHLSFPSDLRDLRIMAGTLEQYKDSHLWYTLMLFGVIYLFKQTYAIPGSFFMNLLAGALFGVIRGFLMVSLLTAVGSSFCFILSALFARPILDRCLAQRIVILRRKLAAERERLFLFLLSARVFPFTPHWLLNICSPFLNVPLYTHFATVGLGLVPYNLLCVRAGRVLSTIHSWHDVIDTTTLIELFCLATILFLVAWISRRRQQPQLPHVATD